MAKKKKELKKLKAKKEMQSKIFMLIFIVAAYFTGLFTLSAISYANLEVCKQGGPEAFAGSQGPVGFVLGNFDK